MSLAEFGELQSTISVTRRAAGSYEDGVWVDGETEEISLSAIVQPMRSRELLNFPEAQRTRQAIKIYCDTELQTADEDAGTRADLVAYGGRSYEVHQVDQYTELGLGHFKAVAFKVDLQAAEPEAEEPPPEEP